MPSPTRPAAAASNGLGRGPPGATDDAHSPSFSLPDRLLVADDQLAPPHRAENLPHFHTSAPRRARGQGSYPSSALSMPSAPPQLQSTTSPMPPARILSGLPSPSSIGRRRQGYSRSRRYMNARQTASDPVRDADDQDFRHAAEHGSLGRADRLEGYGHGHGSAQPWDEMAVRQLQIARGSAPSKLVASRTALQSLQSVDVRELSGSEKTCVICYNDYGVESPEGINEAPLRLPRCRHVFGDHCIKKWFDDSDSCPYCRDKLPSEPKQQLGNARLFMNTMRMRGGPLPAGLPEHMVTRIVAGSIGDLELLEAVARQSRPVERRSPPEDSAAEDQRRTRQRRTAPALNLPSRTVSSFNDDDAATRPRIVPHNLAAAGQQRPRSTLLPAQSQPNRRPARQPRPVGRSESRFAPSAPYLAPSSAAGAQANPVQFQQANRAFDHDRWRGVPPLGGGIPLLNPLQSPGRAPSASFFGILAHSGRSPSNLGPAQGGHGSAPPRGNAPGAAEPAAAAPPPSSLFGDAASSSYRHRPW
ncbi:hypothetical protein RJ55_00319 [Drechmeria coniospora]|nr:hypothetical protein RJ55_00319 [Drechmeria coniospora]